VEQGDTIQQKSTPSMSPIAHAADLESPPHPQDEHEHLQLASEQHLVPAAADLQDPLHEQLFSSQVQL
jgi:hypothetical protein